MIYLDYNATTPVDSRVLETMLPFLSTSFGNPSSVHAFGANALRAVDSARERIATKLGADAQEIIFTSGATESVNLAIKGLYEIYGLKKNHIITVKTEHSAVLNACKYLSTQGAVIEYLDVDNNGLIDIEALKKKITEKTLLIAVMLVNNETGIIQHVEKIGKLAKEKNIFFFCDAAQAVGKINVNVQILQADLLSFSGHKMYAPKGIGGLYVRRKNPRVHLEAQLHGGGQERGLRSGTLNVPGIIAMAKALELFNEEENKRIEYLRNELENSLMKIEGIDRNGGTQRIFNVTNLNFKGISGKSFTAILSKQMAVSSGSACSAKSNEPSHVLMAMGLDEETAKNSVRFSLGRFTKDIDVKSTIEMVSNAYLHLKK